MRLEGYLARRPASHQPLTPAHFLVHAAASHPDRLAVVWRERQWNYREFARLAGRFANWLQAQGFTSGDVISVMLHNRPETLAAHYAVPAIGAVLNCINTRLDVDTISYILEHSDSRILVADRACSAVAQEAAALAGKRILIDWGHHVQHHGRSQQNAPDRCPFLPCQANVQALISKVGAGKCDQHRLPCACLPCGRERNRGFSACSH